MIICNRISKTYAANGPDESRKTLDNVSFTADSGEFICLLGPSGCGKTTLLNIIAGFVQPSEGHVLFDGKSMTGPGPDRGVVFQDPTLFPWLTAAQNIAFGLLNTQGDTPRTRARVAEGLNLVGLTAYANAYPHELSGGMRQRIALARVLVLEPKALLMDEPFSALDAISRERLQDELLDIWQRRPVPIVFVTHNADEAAYLADRIMIMGPPPQSVRRIIPVSLPRPRSRSSEALYRLARVLRTNLGEMPCCITPLNKTEEDS
ncbi:MAG: ABC transporter ATP-binding protein [Desulfatirhabdiaceae bacterium]